MDMTEYGPFKGDESLYCPALCVHVLQYNVVFLCVQSSAGSQIKV